MEYPDDISKNKRKSQKILENPIKFYEILEILGNLRKSQKNKRLEPELTDIMYTEAGKASAESFEIQNYYWLGWYEKFQKNSRKILEKLQKNSRKILEKFQKNSRKILEKFWKNSKKIQKNSRKKF